MEAATSLSATENWPSTLDETINYYLDNPSERASNSWRPLSPGLNSLMNAYTIDTKNESAGTTIGKIILWITSIVLFPISIPVLLFTAVVLYAKDACNEEFKDAKEFYDAAASTEAELREILEKGEDLTEAQKKKFVVEHLDPTRAIYALQTTLAGAAREKDQLARFIRSGMPPDDEAGRIIQEKKEFEEWLKSD